MTSATNGKSLKTAAIHTRLSESFLKMSYPVAAPIVLSSAYGMSTTSEVQGEYIYSRYGNSSRCGVEETMAQLEGAKHCLLFSSGMAAVNAMMSVLNAGDEIVAANQLYGATFDMFQQTMPKRGVTTTLVDIYDSMDPLKNAITSRTKMVWAETCSNPRLQLVDLKKLVSAVKSCNPEALIVVDNTFLSPFILQPLRHGIDVVMESCTKYLGGHCDLLAGSLATNDSVIFEKLLVTQRYHGGGLPPFDSYLLTRSLKTLCIRMQEHGKNCYEVAKFLRDHPCVLKVVHPLFSDHPQHLIAMDQNRGLHSGMVSFYIKGGKEEAIAFLLAVKVFIRAASLGGDHSLALHPMTTTHVQLSTEEQLQAGIVDNLVRLSIGLEDSEDLKEDLDQALWASCNKSNES